jgi:hypothetical protein
MRSLESIDQNHRFAVILTCSRICTIRKTSPVWDRNLPGNPDYTGVYKNWLLPCRPELTHYITEEPEMLLIVQMSSAIGLRWLQIRGVVKSIESPDGRWLPLSWVNTIQPDALYPVVKVNPFPILLIGEDIGWGVQETLDWQLV